MSKILLLIYNQFKNELLYFCLYQVFEIQCILYTHSSCQVGLSTFQVCNSLKWLKATVFVSACLYSLNPHTNSLLIWLLRWLLIHHFYSHTLCSNHIKFQALRTLGFVLVVPCLKYNSSASSGYLSLSSQKRSQKQRLISYSFTRGSDVR